MNKQKKNTPDPAEGSGFEKHVAEAELLPYLAIASTQWYTVMEEKNNMDMFYTHTATP
jgi:hypothetical protein